METVSADLANPDERPRLIADAEKALGPIDILVNNAGLEFAGAFTETTSEQIDLITRVNLEAVMDLTHRALPGMLERGRGHVVNLASLAGKLPSPYLATYGATKHGVVGFTHTLRSSTALRPSASRRSARASSPGSACTAGSSISSASRRRRCGRCRPRQSATPSSKPSARTGPRSVDARGLTKPADRRSTRSHRAASSASSGVADGSSSSLASSPALRKKPSSG